MLTILYLLILFRVESHERGTHTRITEGFIGDCDCSVQGPRSRATVQREGSQ